MGRVVAQDNLLHFFASFHVIFEFNYTHSCILYSLTLPTGAESNISLADTMAWEMAGRILFWHFCLFGHTSYTSLINKNTTRSLKSTYYYFICVFRFTLNLHSTLLHHSDTQSSLLLPLFSHHIPHPRGELHA